MWFAAALQRQVQVHAKADNPLCFPNQQCLLSIIERFIKNDRIEASYEARD
jgi:hypothetical protein